MGLADLPTPGPALDALRRARGFGKGDSRLRDRTAEDKANEKKDEQFRRDIYRLDNGVCRCCGRKVTRKLDRVVDRAEVHHVSGKVGDLRWDVRNGILLDAECHEKVTGRVNERLAIVGSKFFRHKGQWLINARAPVTFKRVA
jgi:hypothetical protein